VRYTRPSCSGGDNTLFFIFVLLSTYHIVLFLTVHAAYCIVLVYSTILEGEWKGKGERERERGRKLGMGIWEGEVEGEGERGGK
jgi:hypothetical protein